MQEYSSYIIQEQYGMKIFTVLRKIVTAKLKKMSIKKQ